MCIRDSRIFWDGWRGWIFVKCYDGGTINEDCISDWTHSIPNACDFYPWEADWSVTQYDPRIQHLVVIEVVRVITTKDILIIGTQEVHLVEKVTGTE